MNSANQFHFSQGLLHEYNKIYFFNYIYFFNQLNTMPTENILIQESLFQKFQVKLHYFGSQLKSIAMVLEPRNSQV